MGVRERVITEVVCDVCGREVKDGTATKTGVLEAKTKGTRGRGERWSLVFHEACYQKLIGSATKPSARPGKRATAKRSTAKRAARRATRAKKTTEAAAA